MSALSGLAVKRLIKEWERLRETPGEGADKVTGGPLTDADMSAWAVKCNNLDHADASPACKLVAQKLKEKGHEPAIEFRIRFPSQYPAEPPFVYVHSPRIAGGHIHGEGAMCLDVLHPSGWSPATKVDSLMRTIRSDIDNMCLRPDWATASGAMRFNTEVLALRGAAWISRMHSAWAEKRAEHPPAPPAPLLPPAHQQDRAPKRKRAQ